MTTYKAAFEIYDITSSVYLSLYKVYQSILSAFSKAEESYLDLFSAVSNLKAVFLKLNVLNNSRCNSHRVLVALGLKHRDLFINAIMYRLALPERAMLVSNFFITVKQFKLKIDTSSV